MDAPKQLLRRPIAIEFILRSPCFPAKVCPSQGLTCEAARDIPDLVPIKLIDQRLRGVPMPCAGVQNSQVRQMVPRSFYLGSRGYSSFDRICGRGNRAGLPVYFKFTTPFSPSRPSHGRGRPCSQARRAAAWTAALRRGPPSSGNPARDQDGARHEHTQLASDP